ncbi:opsin 8, group member c [Antennarius striatus]|uniref:opsin 8, group member c n=1 Tax=Antennarius striatus TaxID=241820 RepID=UPI0035AFF52C
MSPNSTSADSLMPPCVFTSKLSRAGDIGVGLTILSVVLLSVLGNGLVLVICYRRRKKMVGSELLCVNLAVVDFLCCVCFYPLSILSSFRHAWLGENVTCVYYGFGCFIFGLCSMFTITAISIIRYLKICYSLVYAEWLEVANIRKLCFAIWLLATMWSSFPLFGWGKYVPEPYGLSCTVAWRGYHTSSKDAFYVICSFVCFTLFPVLLIAMSQCQILFKVSHFSHMLSTRGIRNNLLYTKKRLSMMFFCISLGFVIAWAPYAIVSFLFIFHKGSLYMAPEGFVFPALFAKSSHIYNPFIYFYFNKSFQQELRLLLTLWPRLGGNRVGNQNSTCHDIPYPIHIELQERGGVDKKNSDLSWGRAQTKRKSKSRSKSKSKSSNLDGRPVYTCWASTANDKKSVFNNKSVVENSPPVSI